MRGEEWKAQGSEEGRHRSSGAAGRRGEGKGSAGHQAEGGQLSERTHGAKGTRRCSGPVENHGRVVCRVVTKAGCSILVISLDIAQQSIPQPTSLQISDSDQDENGK